MKRSVFILFLILLTATLFYSPNLLAQSGTDTSGCTRTEVPNQPTEPEPSQEPTPAPPTRNPQTHTVEMSLSGFSPKILEINKGDTIRFINVGRGAPWPASNIHPSHTSYPGSGIGKCRGAEANSIFDACKSLGGGESFTFTFDKAGTWQYHDHLKPSLRGTIKVR